MSTCTLHPSVPLGLAVCSTLDYVALIFSRTFLSMTVSVSCLCNDDGCDFSFGIDFCFGALTSCSTVPLLGEVLRLILNGQKRDDMEKSIHFTTTNMYRSIISSSVPRTLVAARSIHASPITSKTVTEAVKDTAQSVRVSFSCPVYHLCIENTPL